MKIKKDNNHSDKPKTFKGSIKPLNSSDPKIIAEIVNLSKKYSHSQKYAIQNVSFKIRRGEFHAFLGANGAGKTTTIKSIIGAISNFTGEIFVNKKDIGYIPEDMLFPDISAKKFLNLMALFSGIKNKEAKKRVKEWINYFNLADLANKKPNKMSSGQKRDVLLSQALIHNPELLIADEPVANLDPYARERVYGLFKAMQEQGKAVFVSTHILDEIERYATYITIIDGGKVVFDGPKEKDTNIRELFNKYVKLGSVERNLQPSPNIDSSYGLPSSLPPLPPLQNQHIQSDNLQPQYPPSSSFNNQDTNANSLPATFQNNSDNESKNNDLSQKASMSLDKSYQSNNELIKNVGIENKSLESQDKIN